MSAGQFTDRAEPRVHSRVLGRGCPAFEHGRHSRLRWLSCADESRLKPRLGPAAEAALRPRQFTDRAEPRVHSRLLGRGCPTFEHGRHSRLRRLSCADESRLKPRLGPAAEAASYPVSSLTGPSREFTRDSSGADLPPGRPSLALTRDSSGADPRRLSRAALKDSLTVASSLATLTAPCAVPRSQPAR